MRHLEGRAFLIPSTLESVSVRLKRFSFVGIRRIARCSEVLDYVDENLINGAADASYMGITNRRRPGKILTFTKEFEGRQNITPV